MTTVYHTPISVGAPVNASIVNAPLSSLDTAIGAANVQISSLSATITNLVGGGSSFTQLSLGATTTLTITTGAVTAVRSRHLIGNEGAVALDQLDTINGGADGDILRIQALNAAQVVQVRHNIGNVYLAAETDVYLDNVRKYLDLMYDATNSRWIEQPNTPVIRGVLSATKYAIPVLKIPDALIRTSGGFSGTSMPFLSIAPRPDVRGFVMEKSAAATYESMGMAAGTSAGAGALTNSNQADTVYTNQAIGAVIGTFGGRRSTTFNLLRPQYNPYFAAIIRTGADITNIRFWIGLCQAQVTNVDALLINTSFLGFRYSTVAVDPGWMAVTNDGVPAQTVLTTGVGIAASTAYLLEAYFDDAAQIAYFSVNGSTPVTIATTLPPSADDMGWTASAITTTATAKQFLFGRFYAEMK